jgi:hypothetical protein
MKLIQHFGELGAVVWVREASFFDAWKDDCWIGKFATLNQALYALLVEFEGPDGRVAFVPEGRCDRSLARSAWKVSPERTVP